MNVDYILLADNRSDSGSFLVDILHVPTHQMAVSNIFYSSINFKVLSFVLMLIIFSDFS